MNCDAVELAILADHEGLPASARAHLAGCPACQAFARLHRALLEQEAGAAPSPALDRTVLAAAHGRLRRGGQRLPRLQLLLRAAAALVLLAGVVWVVRPGPAPVPPAAGLALVGARQWAAAEVDLVALESGLDAALAEFGPTADPAAAADAAPDRLESWDALLELEFDVYFESESLRQAGG